MQKTMMPVDANAKITPLHRAVFLMGGVAKLAKAIGVATPTVSRWLNQRQGIPSSFDYCERIERVTNGRVKAEELAPFMASGE